MGDDVRVPTGIEPIRAVRAWRVQGGWLGSSRVADELWVPDARTQAYCRKRQSQAGQPCERPPGDNCGSGFGHGCGLYARKREHMAPQYVSDNCVVGEVDLWGKVIEGEYGYRAEYGRPVSIYRSDNLSTNDLELLCRRYQLEVLPFPDEWRPVPCGRNVTIPGRIRARFTAGDPGVDRGALCAWLERHGVDPSNTWLAEVMETPHIAVYEAATCNGQRHICHCDDDWQGHLARAQPYTVPLKEWPIPNAEGAAA